MEPYSYRWNGADVFKSMLKVRDAIVNAGCPEIWWNNFATDYFNVISKRSLPTVSNFQYSNTTVSTVFKKEDVILIDLDFSQAMNFSDGIILETNQTGPITFTFDEKGLATFYRKLTSFAFSLLKAPHLRISIDNYNNTEIIALKMYNYRTVLMGQETLIRTGLISVEETSDVPDYFLIDVKGGSFKVTTGSLEGSLWDVKNVTSVFSFWFEGEYGSVTVIPIFEVKNQFAIIARPSRITKFGLKTNSSMITELPFLGTFISAQTSRNTLSFASYFKVLACDSLVTADILSMTGSYFYQSFEMSDLLEKSCPKYLFYEISNKGSTGIPFLVENMLVYEKKIEQDSVIEFNASQDDVFSLLRLSNHLLGH